MTGMAISQAPHQGAGPGQETGDRSRPGPTVIPGEVVRRTVETGPEDQLDDIAPGVIEYYTPRPPMVSRVASATVVAARYTGRGAGWSARTGWLLARWFGHGARACAVLGHRYIRAHDHIDALGGTSGPAWRKILDTRVRRWRFLGYGAGALTAADLAAWWALVRYEHMAALGGSYAVAPAAETVAAAAVLTLYGRYRLAAKLTPTQVVDPEDVDDGVEPYPLVWCQSGDQVRECVGRALAAEGIATRRIDILGNRKWGWEVDIDLKGSTPGKVIAAADQLDAHFDVKHGGTMIEPDVQRAAHITLRLITSDPFADMPAPAVHAPNSLDVADPHHFGLSMDGRALEIVLEGTRVLVIGVSGSAKSTGVLRDLAEVITACHNAIALDLDPIKDGLREFEGVMAVPPIRGNEACELWLKRLVAMAEARNRVRNRLGMGDTWVATDQHPAIFPIVDEFIYLSKDAKALFIMLLRLGKQSGIYPIAAGQDATSDSLGDAIADSFTLAIALAARHADIPIVLGSGAIAAGWRPDRLTPAQNKDIRNDAGRSYIKGAGLTRPILYGWNEHSRTGIQRAVAERQSAGRPWFDHDTLAEADLVHLAAQYGRSRITLADRLDDLGTADSRTVAALLRLFDDRQAQFLPTAQIVAAGVAVDGVELQTILSRLVPMAKAGREYVDGTQARGWSRQVAEQAAAVLFAPS